MTVGGQPRPVVLSTFVDTATTAEQVAPLPAIPASDALWPVAVPSRAPVRTTDGRHRTILLAFDATSFDTSDARQVARAIDTFTSGLTPDDQVGLVSYPLGPSLDPTTDREALARAVSELTGQREPDNGQIGPSDVVDWFAEPAAQAEIVAGGLSRQRPAVRRPRGVRHQHAGQHGRSQCPRGAGYAHVRRARHAHAPRPESPRRHHGWPAHQRQAGWASRRARRR